MQKNAPAAGSVYNAFAKSNCLKNNSVDVSKLCAAFFKKTLCLITYWRALESLRNVQMFWGFVTKNFCRFKFDMFGISQLVKGMPHCLLNSTCFAQVREKRVRCVCRAFECCCKCFVLRVGRFFNLLT